jgi:hypothetical protein
MRKLFLLIFLILNITVNAYSERWSEKKANDWYNKQPWLVGSNYIPANAINQLEMWQAESFDPQTIDKELGWAASLGMNTMRVFLHDLLWQQDPDGYKKRIDKFLQIAAKHKIKIMQLGKQRAPQSGIHNSGWVQSPGSKALQDPTQYARLESYIKGIVKAFAKDKRVIVWDVWNEPDNTNDNSYVKIEPANKVNFVKDLLPKVFLWAREVKPKQPLTSGVWKGDWSTPEKLSAIEKLQLDLSDIISFHNYSSPDDFEKRVKWLQRYNRPLICTEYLARGFNSTFQGIMPVAKTHRVALYNWGLVVGKTQTHLPWDSWQTPYIDREPSVWHHEILYSDGRPYKEEEVDFIKKMTGVKSSNTSKKISSLFYLEDLNVYQALTKQTDQTLVHLFEPIRGMDQARLQ